MRQLWDEFVDSSKNGTFLFKRDYMEYHCDRFEDYSLMAFSDKHGLIGILPANVSGNTVYSHGGLTYGGWATSLRHFNMLTMMEVWKAMEEEYRASGMTSLVYRMIPYIYHKYPSDEDMYAIFRAGGSLSESKVSTTICLEDPLPFDMGASQRVKKVRKLGVEIGQSTDFAGFWSILSSMLKERYDASPVHTLDEMLKLSRLFPDNIKLYTAALGGEILAGTVIYFSDTVAHTQYTCASPEGKKSGVLPALYSYIINNECGSCRYFDFGTSNEEEGRYLNEGLIEQKCGLGGRAVACNTYLIPL